MGCWNGTCMISQLPIECNEHVVVIPIQRVIHETLPNHSLCYSDTLYQPLPIVLEGEYDDYGSITNVTGDIEQFVDFVTKKSDLTVKQMNEKHYTNFENDVEACLRHVERDELDGIGFVMIHKELFDKLLGTYGGYGNPHSLALKIAESTRNYDKNNILSSIKSSEYIRRFGPNIIKDCNPDSVESVIRIRCAVEELRKIWMPQSGAGSQDTISETHIALLNFFDNYITEHNYEEDDY